MIKKKFKCQRCGYTFVIEIFESQEEAEEIMQRNPRKKITKVHCRNCGAPVQ